MKPYYIIASVFLLVFSIRESSAAEEESFFETLYNQTYHRLSSFFFNQDEGVKDDRLGKLTPEIQLKIVRFLNQRDVPNITRTNVQLCELMKDNQLWKEYAERALVIISGKYYEDIDYKALVQYNCTPAFMYLGTLNGGQIWPHDMSFDGSKIVGYAVQGLETAFVYILVNGMQSLGSLKDGTSSHGTAISSNGQCIVWS